MHETEVDLFLPVEGGGEDDVTCTVKFTPGWFRRGNRSWHPDTWSEDEGEYPDITSVVRTDTNEEILGSLSPEKLKLVENEVILWEERCWEERCYGTD